MREKWRTVTWATLAVFVGICLAFGLSQTGRIVFNPLNDLAALGGLFGNRIDESVTAPGKVGREILVDLSTMTLDLYDQGELQKSFPLKAKGKPGSAWETPAGTYAIKTKELKHFSSIGHVWMPYSMQFFGNFFIHGWPSDESGRPVPEGYSGGCIRLSTKDAAEVFDFAGIGTKVVVKNPPLKAADQIAATYSWRRILKPELRAESYLVADLDSGEVLMSRQGDLVLPIASVTKLMTALTSLEAINQEQQAIVSARALETFGESGGLKLGEQLRVKDLLYPLLLESSNDAAEVLAEAAGRPHFIDLMNEKAKAIGLSDTRFDDPSGISPINVSSAADLFRFLKYLNTNKQYVLSITQKGQQVVGEHQWVNANKFAYDHRYRGGKTGKTTQAKETFAGIFSIPQSEFNRRNIAIILLASDERDSDIEQVLRYLVETGETETKPKLEAKSDAVTMTFVGDIMLDRGVASSVIKNGNSDYDWLFEAVGELSKADITYGNLEGPVSDQGSDRGNLYSFRMKPAALDAVAAAGFDVLQLANNHAGDWGAAAFADSVARVEAAGLGVAGGGSAAAVTRPRILERNGVKFGFLAASDVGPDWLQATENQTGILLASNPRLAETIRAAANEVDVLVVGFHFGEEYQKEPNDRQRTLAHLAIDNGAKLVIGSHPHVTEPVEEYKDGLIAYSLGNFIFDQYFSAETMSGSALNVTLEGKEIKSFEERKIALDKTFKPHFE